MTTKTEEETLECRIRGIYNKVGFNREKTREKYCTYYSVSHIREPFVCPMRSDKVVQIFRGKGGLYFYLPFYKCKR